MAENSRGLIFRKRNVLGAAMLAGIGLGVYLGQLGFFPGFGKPGIGGRNDGSDDTRTEINGDASDRPNAPRSDSGQTEALPAIVPDVVQVIIDDRQYLLLRGDKTTSVELPDLIQLIKKAPGDSDHIQVRIYRRLSRRASAEEALKKELISAEIPETAVYWVPVNPGR